MMWILLPFLTLTGTLCSLAEAANCVGCGTQYTCKNVTLADTYLDFFDGPYYDMVLTNVTQNQKVDNVCNTIFPIGPYTFVVFRTTVYLNGTYRVERQVQIQDEASPQTIYSQGLFAESGCSTCVYQYTTIAEPCPGVYLNYVCYTFGECTAFRDRSDLQIGISKDPCITSSCSMRVRAAARAQNLTSPSGFLVAPNKLDKKCVTMFNNASCNNCDRVPAWDSISLP